MVIVEKLLFGEVEHKVEFLPFSIHWALLACVNRRTGRGGGESKRDRREG